MFKKGFNKELARAMALYITYSVVGPLLVFGSIGYIVDHIFETRFFLLFSILVSYVISNILMFKKLKKINQSIAKIDLESSKNKESQDSKDLPDDLDFKD